MCRFKDGIIALITEKNNKSWYIKKFNNFFTMIKKKKNIYGTIIVMILLKDFYYTFCDVSGYLVSRF